MRSDFEIKGGIILSKPPYDLDLHNNYDFQDLKYSVKDRTLVLLWIRSVREGIPANIPGSVSVEFREVAEFQFQPRDRDMPFTEDDCLQAFGFWGHAEWEGGVMVVDPAQPSKEDWLTAIQFMSGAVALVRATSAHALICA